MACRAPRRQGCVVVRPRRRRRLEWALFRVHGTEVLRRARSAADDPHLEHPDPMMEEVRGPTFNCPSRPRCSGRQLAPPRWATRRRASSDCSRPHRIDHLH
jgi:hypothetical protein